MSYLLAVTIIADDRPGIVEQIAGVVSRNEGNWLESAMSRLGGKFAGILLAHIPAQQEAAFRADLAALATEGIRASVELAGSDAPGNDDKVTLTVIGNDRKGIVKEISTLLASHRVNVRQLHTSCENAPMSGERLFRTEATVELPQGLAMEGLVALLEGLSDDLVVEFEE